MNFKASEEMPIFLSEIEAHVNGSVKLEKALVTWPYGVFCPNLQAEVQGTVGFKVKSMDKGLTLLTDLQVLEGYIRSRETLEWDEWNIPWETVLTSPYHTLLVSSVALSLVVFGIHKKGVRIRIIRSKSRHKD